LLLRPLALATLAMRPVATQVPVAAAPVAVLLATIATPTLVP